MTLVSNMANSVVLSIQIVELYSRVLILGPYTGWPKIKYQKSSSGFFSGTWLTTLNMLKTVFPRMVIMSII